MERLWGCLASLFALLYSILKLCAAISLEDHTLFKAIKDRFNADLITVANTQTSTCALPCIDDAIFRGISGLR